MVNFFTLQVQKDSSTPGLLKHLYDLVNKAKHSGTSRSAFFSVVKDPVTLARQCTDKVEEICNFFFDAMTEAKELRNKVERLTSDINNGKHEKAEELLRVLEDNEDFVIRMGSTWKLLEVFFIFGITL